MNYLENRSPRTKELFSFDWHYYYGDIDVDTAISDGFDGFSDVTLPHDWSVSFPFDENADTCGSGGYVKAGIGWYKKSFRVSKTADMKKLSLCFDGAYMNAEVWLNGVYMGLHVFGYTPFEFDITEHVHSDKENMLAVRIDNSKQPGSRWYSGSGITRDVWIVARNQVHIPTDGTYVTTVENGNDADVKAMTRITAPYILAGNKAKLITRIIDSEGKTVSEAIKELVLKQNQEITQIQTVHTPKLWSDKSPYLYRAVSMIEMDGNVIDEYETVFGIRTICFDPDNGFLLNGVRTKINGFCVHHDAGCLGAAVPRKVWERRLKTMKAMGSNGVRCSHNPPDPALLDLCDELGFLVMDEPFDEWEILKGKAFGSNTHESKGYSEWFSDHHEEDIKAMLYRDRNHASIILWSIGNEIPEQKVSGGYLLARKLKGLCYSIDPTRPITLANDQIAAEPVCAREEFLNELDIVGYNYTGRWRTRAETLYDDDKRRHPEWCMVGSENPSANGLRAEYFFEPNAGFFRVPYYAIPMNASKLLRFTMSHDYVAGDFMWTGIDYLGESHWPDRSSSFGVLDTCGFIKDSYYLYKSIWNTEEPMVYAYPHWNLDIEQGRVIPVICYTNCEYAELFLNGKSYGKKAHSYPLYGMSGRYGRSDKVKFPACTDDLFLSWDVPYEHGVVEVIGYNNGTEVCRHHMKTTGQPAQLIVSSDNDILMADGRDIAHLTISVVDPNGILVPNAKNRISFEVQGEGKLIGIDNGNPRSYDSFQGTEMDAYGGFVLAILQSDRKPGEILVTAKADGLKSTTIILKVK